MEIHDIQQVLRWMQQARLCQFSLTSPQSQILLRRQQHNPRSLTQQDTVTPLASSGTPESIIAHCAGTFLPCHPAHEAPQAAPGSQVEQGDIVAFLAVDTLLLPVVAPCAGTLSEALVGKGTLVEYGTTLFTVLRSDTST